MKLVAFIDTIIRAFQGISTFFGKSAPNELIFVAVSVVVGGVFISANFAFDVLYRCKTNLVSRAFSSFKMAVRESSQSSSKNWLAFCRVNTLKCLRFV